MKQRSKTDTEDRAERDPLTEVLRAGAQKLLAQALEAEVAELLAVYAVEDRAPRCPGFRSTAYAVVTEKTPALAEGSAASLHIPAATVAASASFVRPGEELGRVSAARRTRTLRRTE